MRPKCVGRLLIKVQAYTERSASASHRSFSQADLDTPNGGIGRAGERDSGDESFLRLVISVGRESLNLDDQWVVVEHVLHPVALDQEVPDRDPEREVEQVCVGDRLTGTVGSDIGHER